MPSKTLMQAQARKTVQTARVEGEYGPLRTDSKGSLLTTPYQVRDLVATATVTLANNAADNETTLISGDSTSYLDFVYISGANASDKAIRVVFREGSGGTDLFNLTMVASSTDEMHFTVPWPQNTKGLPWRVDFDTNANIVDPNDVTNTTVKITALYIKNV